MHYKNVHGLAIVK